MANGSQDGRWRVADLVIRLSVLQKVIGDLRNLVRRGYICLLSSFCVRIARQYASTAVPLRDTAHWARSVDKTYDHNATVMMAQRNLGCAW
jgi:hypothetical protein